MLERYKALVPCACGCGESRRQYDEQYKKRYYVAGHQNNGRQTRGPTHGSWKGGRIIDKDGYVRISSYGNPRATKNGYILEHILVMEKHLGRHIISGREDIHHKNGNRQDNRVENLQLMTHGEHRSYHGHGDHSS